MPVHFSSFKNPFAEKYQEINWKDGFYRKDIGWKVINKHANN